MLHFTELCHILLDSIPVNNIADLFTSQKIFTDDDINVISFAPNEYLKKKVLLYWLLCLKLPTWLIIHDVLSNNESMRSVGDQLMQGKLL